MHCSVLPSEPLPLSGRSTGSSTCCWVVWPPPRRWQTLWPRPSTHGQAWGLSLCRICRKDEVRWDGLSEAEKADTMQAMDQGYSRLWSFVLQDLEGTVHGVFVAVSLQTLKKTNKRLKRGKPGDSRITSGWTSYLHPGLHHIQRCISKNTGSSGRCTEHRCDNRVHVSSGIIPFEAKSRSWIHGGWKEDSGIFFSERTWIVGGKKRGQRHWILFCSLSHLCTNFVMHSSHRTEWPDCFLVSALSLSDLDTSPAHLRSNRLGFSMEHNTFTTVSMFLDPLLSLPCSLIISLTPWKKPL